jgi:hypothetical protein
MRWQIRRLNHHGRATKECGNLLSLTLGKAEFIHQLSCGFSEYEFGYHKLVAQQQVFKQLGTHACAADMSRNQYRRIKRDPHFFCRTSKTSSSVLIPPACARVTSLDRNVRNSATRR